MSDLIDDQYLVFKSVMDEYVPAEVIKQLGPMPVPSVVVRQIMARYEQDCVVAEGLLCVTLQEPFRRLLPHRSLIGGQLRAEEVPAMIASERQAVVSTFEALSTTDAGDSAGVEHHGLCRGTGA
ncbi:hypothetical protein [Nocardia asteroides]|uniref:hypothetical protein n=1 Tax=Nocardia asteroides TaxID=1824 RepID=UPI0033F24B2E